MNVEPILDCLSVLLIGFGLILGDASLSRDRAVRRRQQRDARVAELEVELGIVERDDVAFASSRLPPTHPLLDADMRRKSELQRKMDRGLGR